MKVSVMLLNVSSSFTPKSWVALATGPHSLVCCSMEGRQGQGMKGQVLGPQAGPACQLDVETCCPRGAPVRMGLRHPCLAGPPLQNVAPGCAALAAAWPSPAAFVRAQQLMQPYGPAAARP